jgi:hypothetical protein
MSLSKSFLDPSYYMTGNKVSNIWRTSMVAKKKAVKKAAKKKVAKKKAAKKKVAKKK